MTIKSTSQTLNLESMSLETRLAKSGVPTLRVHAPNGRAVWIHSAYDPEREADDFLAAHREEIEQADFIVLLGLGLGYHVERVLNLLEEEQVLVVGEAFPEVLDKLVESRGSSVFRSQNVVMYGGADPQAFRTVLAQHYRSLQHDKVLVLDHPGSCRAFPEVYKGFREEIRSVLTTTVTDLATRIFWNVTWIRNSLKNLDTWVFAPGVNSLYDRFTGVPGILVSAGPSLSKNIAELRAAKGKALIIAVDTALRPLLKEGIKPDLVIGIDAGEANGRLFEGLNYADIPLVMEPMIYPSILTGHRGPKFVCHIGNSLAMWLAPVIGEKGLLGCGGSVANTAFDLLKHLGCDPLILVGQDLAFTDGYTHSKGTKYEGNQVDPTKNKGLVTVQGVDGQPILTSRILYSFLQWFEQYTFHLKGKRRVIDATEGGAFIEGTELSSLRHATQQYCLSPADINLVLREVYDSYSPPDLREVRRFLEEGFSRVEEIEGVARRGMRLAEKLLKQVARGELRSPSTSKTVRALDRIDEELKGQQDNFLLLRDALYPAVVRVLKNVQGKAPEGETEQERSKRVVEQSSTLYTALYYGARELKDWIKAVDGYQNVRSGYAKVGMLNAEVN